MLFYFLAFTGHPSKSLLHHENLHKATTKVKSNRASVNKVGVPKKVLALARLGVEVLEYPEVQGSKKKNSTNYLLGNGIALKHHLEEDFLCREYPEINNCKNIPHNPVFVPDTFFYYNNSSSSLPRQPNINGENLAKKELFHKIKSVCMEGRKNLTIFSGWKDEVIMGKRKARKFDFLIVSADARTIIHIECKNEYSEKHLSQAVFSFNKFIWSFHLYISKILEKTNSKHTALCGYDSCPSYELLLFLGYQNKLLINY